MTPHRAAKPARAGPVDTRPHPVPGAARIAAGADEAAVADGDEGAGVAVGTPVSGAIAGCSLALMAVSIPVLHNFVRNCTAAAWLRRLPLAR